MPGQHEQIHAVYIVKPSQCRHNCKNRRSIFLIKNPAGTLRQAQIHPIMSTKVQSCSRDSLFISNTCFREKQLDKQWNANYEGENNHTSAIITLVEVFFCQNIFFFSTNLPFIQKFVFLFVVYVLRSIYVGGGGGGQVLLYANRIKNI